MEDYILNRWQDSEFIEYEARCKCCGICCGSKDNDPCIHLKTSESGRCYCDTYATRFGLQSTVTGKEFTCVMIRDVINFGVRYEGCGYNA